MDLSARIDDEPRRVLIADDDPSLRSLVHTTLSNLGFEICEAEDGDTALELGQRLGVQVAILDVAMPGLDGREVCIRLKERVAGAGPGPRVVMLTGTKEPPD
jgi:CheY-like chemotaxis protein